MTQTLIDPRMFDTAQPLGAHDGSSLTGIESDLVKITETNITGATATVDFTGISATYDQYMFIGNNLSRNGSANTSVSVRLSNNGGSSFHSSNYMYVNDNAIIYSGGGPATGSNGSYSNAYLRLLASVNSSTFACNFVLYLHHPLDASNFTYINGTGTSIYDVTNDPFSTCNFAGKYNTAEANNAIRFMLESGSFGDGQITMYGIK